MKVVYTKTHTSSHYETKENKTRQFEIKGYKIKTKFDQKVIMMNNNGIKMLKKNLW